MISYKNNKKKEKIMITNDQMIAQILANLQRLNNQIELNLNILSNLDSMHSESAGGSHNLHDQVSHIRNGHDTLNNGLQSARSVSGYNEIFDEDERIS